MIQVIFLFLFITATAGPVHAYLDPGTGSYITQLLIGLLLGSAYLGRVYWRKIKTYITSLFKSSKSHEKKDSK